MRSPRRASARWTGAIRVSILLLIPAVAPDAVAQEIVGASPDIAIDRAASVIASDADIAVDDQLRVVVLANVGPLPEASDVVAYGLDSFGDRLLAFDSTVALPGGVVARPGDVVRYDGAAYSIEFDASVAGLPRHVAVDATSLAAGGLLLSFDTTVDLGGAVVVADEDLVVWNGASFAMVFDGSTAGLDASLDVDAAQDLGSGAYLISLDTAGEVGGIPFADEDAMRFDGSSWTLEFDGSAASPAWVASDLDAIMVPEPGVARALATGLAFVSALARRRRVQRSDMTARCYGTQNDLDR